MNRPEIIVYRDADEDLVIKVNDVWRQVTILGEVRIDCVIDRPSSLIEVWRSGDKS